MLNICAFTAVALGYPLSIGLLPLACVGVVVFQLFMFVRQVFAHVDVMLANMVLPSGELKLRTKKSIQSGITAPIESTIWKRLCFVSSETVAVSLYFLTFKLILAIIGFAAMLAWLGIPIMALVTWGDHVSLVMASHTTPNQSGTFAPSVPASLVAWCSSLL